MAALALWMRTADMPMTDTRAYRGGSIIAAVAAGLALSVRLNLLAPVGALTLVAIALTPSGRRRSATGWWIGGLVLAGGYWYARNLIALGNPLPWFSFGVLPTPHPPPLQHGNNYSLADYATYPRILRHWLIPALNLNLGPWWPALVAAAVVGPLVCLFSKRDRVILAAALIALASLVAYPLTPLTACGPWGHPYCLKLNIRYGAPALTLALAVTPLALLFRSKLGRLAAAAGLTTLFVATVALRRLWTPDYNLDGAHAAVIPVLVVAVIVVLRPWSLITLRRPLVRATAATLALSLVLAGVAVGYSGTRDYLRHRYTDKYGPSAVYKVWRWARGLHHAQIALAGTFGWFFGYPLWGLDDSNRVGYMGQHGPHGSFRPITSCRAWRTALNRGHYQYVVTTASRIFFTTHLVYSPEVDWTRTDPAARLVLSPNRAIQVFRLTGPAPPGSLLKPLPTISTAPSSALPCRRIRLPGCELHCRQRDRDPRLLQVHVVGVDDALGRDDVLVERLVSCRHCHPARCPGCVPARRHGSRARNSSRSRRTSAPWLRDQPSPRKLARAIRPTCARRQRSRAPPIVHSSRVRTRFVVSFGEVLAEAVEAGLPTRAPRADPSLHGPQG